MGEEVTGSVFITFSSVKHNSWHPQLSGGEVYCGSRFSLWSAEPQAETAWQRGRQGKAAYVMAARKQRARKGAGEGDDPFQVTPSVTHLSDQTPPNPITLQNHEALGTILDLSHNKVPVLFPASKQDSTRDHETTFLF